MITIHNTPGSIAVSGMFLVGMPYAGKSYWGRTVADHFGLPFIDLDDYIARKERNTIPGIFEAAGEAGFREVERQCLIEVIRDAGQGSIVACGGGTPCFYDNMQLMKAAGMVVYIQASPAYLLANYDRSTQTRPLFGNARPTLSQLEELLARRAPFYEQAHHILHSADISIATFEQILGDV